jgi:YgiT-type zinc finger domain-containing protein
MSSEQAELETRMVKQAEKAIRHLLEQKSGRRDLSMSEMEDLVGRFEVEVRQALMQEMVADAQVDKRGLCETCGGRLRYKGKKTKQVVTLRGEVRLERDYYQCEQCGAGYFPPG